MKPDLDAIRARCEAAAPGPWVREELEIRSFVRNRCQMVIYDEGGHDEQDAEFIAHARTDVPALIARVRELETQLRIERENVAELEERLVLCQRTNDRMRERIGVKPPPWGMNK